MMVKVPRPPTQIVEPRRPVIPTYVPNRPPTQNDLRVTRTNYWYGVLDRTYGRSTDNLRDSDSVNFSDYIEAKTHKAKPRWVEESHEEFKPYFPDAKTYWIPMGRYDKPAVSKFSDKHQDSIRIWEGITYKRSHFEPGRPKDEVFLLDNIGLAVLRHIFRPKPQLPEDIIGKYNVQAKIRTQKASKYGKNRKKYQTLHGYRPSKKVQRHRGMHRSRNYYHTSSRGYWRPKSRDW